MNNEKVKEIKESLQQEIHSAEYVDSSYANIVSLDLLKDILTLINDLEGENNIFLKSKIMWKCLHSELCKENQQLKDEKETIKFNMQETEKASFNINQMNGNLVIENQQLKDRIAELEKENDEQYKRIMGLEQDLVHADEKVFYRESNITLRENEIKQQAIKQFAERLKEKLEEYRLENEYFTEHEPNGNLWQMNSSVFCIEVTQDGGLVDETLKEFINERD